MTFQKATKTNSKLRLAITGTAGSGKTYGALLIAQGLGGNIAMIDSENGSGNVYADLCDYDICNLSAPYDPRKYVQCIHEAEQAGYNVIIIDSISHEWNGSGGCLDLHDKEAAGGKNSFAAWAKVTPLHNFLLQAILASSCHIIATIRSKADYIINDNRQVQKVGIAPVQREGIEFEFSTVFDVNDKHLAIVSKDRTRLFPDTPFQITNHVGKILLKWLNSDSNKKGD